MLPDLPRWLREVELEPGSERQAAIGAAAGSLADSAGGYQLLDLVLLAHGDAQGEASDAVSQAVRAVDPTFGAAPTDLEMHLAAGAAVAAILGKPTTGTLAAHAVLTARWLGLPPAIAELHQLAQAALVERSEVLRARGTFPTTSTVEKALAELPAFETDGQGVVYQEARAVVDATKKASNALSALMKRVAAECESRLDAADEELNILWWAFASRSERVRSAWSDITPSAAAALIAGVEFAGLLRFEAELPSTESLLSRVLGGVSTEQGQITGAVEAAAQHLTDLQLPEKGHRLLPMLSSLIEYRALNGQKEWRKSTSRWQVDSSAGSDALGLATQAVREVLSSKSL